MQRIALAGLTGLVALSLAAPAQAKVQAVVVQWGEIEVGEVAGPLGPEYQEHSLSHGHAVSSSHYVNHDETVPAQLCRSFGFEAWLTRGPGDVLPDRVLLRVNHPVLTRPDGVSSSQDTLLLPVQNGAVTTSFGFDAPWEARPGRWTFELVLAGEVIATKAFTVTTPEPGAPAPNCPGRAVS